MARDDHYKIGLLIAALCAITWMFLSDAWGAVSKDKQYDCSRCHSFTRPERGLR